MKINKKAFITPFFTPLIAIIICIVVGILGMLYTHYIIEKHEEENPPVEEEIVETSKLIAKETLGY